MIFNSWIFQFLQFDFLNFSSQTNIKYYLEVSIVHIEVPETEKNKIINTVCKKLIN